jgi:hypothetical protein
MPPISGWDCAIQVQLFYVLSSSGFKLGVWRSQTTQLTTDITFSVWGYMVYGLDFYPRILFVG